MRDRLRVTGERELRVVAQRLRDGEEGERLHVEVDELAERREALGCKRARCGGGGERRRRRVRVSSWPLRRSSPLTLPATRLAITSSSVVLPQLDAPITPCTSPWPTRSVTSLRNCAVTGGA